MKKFYILFAIMLVYGTSTAFGTVTWTEDWDNRQPWALAKMSFDQQTDWDCGIHSGYRLIATYDPEFARPYDLVMAEVGQFSYVYKGFSFTPGVGRPPSQLSSKLNAYYNSNFPYSFTKSGYNTFDYLINLLNSGITPMALLYVGDDERTQFILGIETSLFRYPLLHWIIVNGYDASTDKIHYIDTTSPHVAEMSRVTFEQQWNWDIPGDNYNENPAQNPVQGYLEFIVGIAKRTLLWIDKTSPEAQTLLGTFDGNAISAQQHANAVAEELLQIEIWLTDAQAADTSVDQNVASAETALYNVTNASLLNSLLYEGLSHVQNLKTDSQNQELIISARESNIIEAIGRINKKIININYILERVMGITDINDDLKQTALATINAALQEAEADLATSEWHLVSVQTIMANLGAKLNTFVTVEAAFSALKIKRQAMKSHLSNSILLL